MKQVFLIPHTGGPCTPYYNLGKSFPSYEYARLEFAHFVEMANIDRLNKLFGDKK